VDRIGQRSTVHAFNLIAADSGEIHLLNQLKARIAVARHDLGVGDPFGMDETDEETFRSVVLNRQTPRPRTLSAWTGRPILSGSPNNLLIDLASLARSEHARLVFLRRLLDGLPDPQVAEDHLDALLAFARKPATRRRLGTHLLVVSISTCSDAAGRIVASRITPVAVDWTRGVLRAEARLAVSNVLASLDFAHPPLADQLDTNLLADFWSVRLTRERAIAGMLATTTDQKFQPGLFDRRAEVEADARTAANREAALRLAALEACAHRATLDVRPALVLFP
jgi:hypothetical protein